MRLFRIRDFIRLEAASGIILLAMSLLALMLANSPLRAAYHEIFETMIVAQKSLRFCINEGLMAVFFFLVGLEIKREVLLGELNSKAKIALPAIAALGGMLFPALIYLVFNYAEKYTLKGWAIPTATDIAFAVGVLSLFGKRIPSSLKAFLLTLAILDDLGAICLIAGVYSSLLLNAYIVVLFICMVLLWGLHKYAYPKPLVYLLLGAILWLSVFKIGVHATVAGVILSLFIPIAPIQQQSLLHRLETSLHPWVAYGVLPLFALANAGVTLDFTSLQALWNAFPLGIILGLCIGKQCGIFLTSYLFIKMGYATLPSGATWRQLYGVAILCGMGFTMSLFISDLAFGEFGNGYLNIAKLSVFLGSLIAGIIGYAWLAASV